MRIFYALVALVITFVVYCFALGPLRHTFQKWPYVTVFLPQPGLAALHIVLFAGFACAVFFVIQRRRYAILFACGFGMLLVAPLLNALWIAWHLSHPIKVDDRTPVGTFEYEFLKIYYRYDIPHCISAIGTVLLILGMLRGFRFAAHDERFYGKPVNLSADDAKGQR